MKAVKSCLVILAIGALFCLFDIFSVLGESEQAVVTRLGTPVASVKEAGLHLKMPFIETITRYEKRSLRWDSGLLEIPTKDGTVMSVNATAGWRIADPMKFHETVRTYEQAYARLDRTIDSILKDTVSRNPLSELVRSSGSLYMEGIGQETSRIPELAGPEISRKILLGREKITHSMASEASKSLSRFGMEVIDLRFKRLSYPERATAKVFERMISERRYRAARLKSEGEGRKAEILGQMERELLAVRSEAARSADEIQGRADGEAAGIYGRAYGKDPEFSTFFKTLQTYRETPFENTTLILGTDSEFYRFLKGTKK